MSPLEQQSPVNSVRRSDDALRGAFVFGRRDFLRAGAGALFAGSALAGEPVPRSPKEVEKLDQVRKMIEADCNKRYVDLSLRDALEGGVGDMAFSRAAPRTRHPQWPSTHHRGIDMPGGSTGMLWNAMRVIDEINGRDTARTPKEVHAFLWKAMMDGQNPSLEVSHEVLLPKVQALLPPGQRLKDDASKAPEHFGGILGGKYYTKIQEAFGESCVSAHAEEPGMKQILKHIGGYILPQDRAKTLPRFPFTINFVQEPKNVAAMITVYSVRPADKDGYLPLTDPYRLVNDSLPNGQSVFVKYPQAQRWKESGVFHNIIKPQISFKHHDSAWALFRKYNRAEEESILAKHPDLPLFSANFDPSRKGENRISLSHGGPAAPYRAAPMK